MEQPHRKESILIERFQQIAEVEEDYQYTMLIYFYVTANFDYFMLISIYLLNAMVWGCAWVRTWGSNFDKASRGGVMESQMMAADSSYKSSTQTQVVMGKESIVFNNPITIPSQVKVSLDYDIDNEFEYTKQNT